MSKVNLLRSHAFSVDGGPSFPLRFPSFVQQQEVRVKCKRAFVIEIYDSDFTEGARSYADLCIGRDNPLGAARVAMMQLWLFALHVLSIRVDKNAYNTTEYPVQVYLEMLYAKEKGAGGGPCMTNGHRLWIFECENRDSLVSIVTDAVRSNKKLNPDGTFIDLADGGAPAAPEPGAKERGAFAVTDASDKGKSSMRAATRPAPTTKQAVKLEERYKNITDGASLAAVTDAVSGQIFSTRNSKSMNTKRIPLAHVLTPEMALKRTARTVIEEQRRIETYLRHEDTEASTCEFVLPFFKAVFFIPQFCYHPHYFFTRSLPWWQVTDKQIKWQKFMNGIASKIRAEIEAADQPAPAEDDDGSSVGGEFEMEVDADGDKSSATMRNLVFERPAKITNDQVGDMLKHYGIIVERDERELEIGDFVSSMQHAFDAQLAMLEHEYRDDKTELRCKLEMLIDDTLTRFEAHCTQGESDVSKAQQALNKYFIKKKLGDKHMHVNITDPSKTAIENFMIFLESAFTVHSGIATAQHLCTFLYIMGGDRFRRMLDLHGNPLLCGSNSAGKSKVLETMARCFLLESCTMVNSSSDLADAVDETETDVMEMGDDITFDEKMSKKPEVVSREKAQMTSMVTTRKVLMQDPRRSELLRGLKVGQRYANTNDSIYSVQDAQKSQFGQQSSHRSNEALVTRWINLEMPRHENNIYNVRQAMSREDAKEEPIKDEDQAFYDLMIRAHTIVGWAQKLLSISRNIVDVSMRCFDMMWNQLIAALKTHGLETSHARVAQQARLFCYQLVLMDAYVTNHCIEGSPFFGVPFKVHQIHQWKPICYEHHVIISLSFFFYDFYPPMLEPVMTTLSAMFNEARTNGDPRIVFAEQNKARRRAADDNERAEARSTMETMKHMMSTVLLGAAKSVGGEYVPNPPLRTRDDTMLAAAHAVGEAERRKGVGRGGAYNVGPQQPAPPRQDEAFDCSRVEFRYTLQDLAQVVAVRLKTQENSVKWGRDAIAAAIHKMTSIPVVSKKWVARPGDGDEPRIDETSKETTSIAVQIAREGAITVHFSVIKQHYNAVDILRNVLKWYCNKYTMRREVLLGMDHPTFPWLYQSIVMRRSERELRIRNSTALLPSTMLALRPYEPPESVLVVREQHSDEPAPAPFIQQDMEINAMMVLGHFKRELELGLLKAEDVLMHTPEEQVRRFMAEARARRAAQVHGDAWKPARYPLDWEIEAHMYNRVYRAQQARTALDIDAESPDDIDAEDIARKMAKYGEFDADGNPVLTNRELRSLLVTPYPRLEMMTEAQLDEKYTHRIFDARKGRRMVESMTEKLPQINIEENKRALARHQEQNRATQISVDAIIAIRTRFVEPGSDDASAIARARAERIARDRATMKVTNDKIEAMMGSYDDLDGDAAPRPARGLAELALALDAAEDGDSQPSLSSSARKRAQEQDEARDAAMADGGFGVDDDADGDDDDDDDDDNFLAEYGVRRPAKRAKTTPEDEAAKLLAEFDF